MVIATHLMQQGVRAGEYGLTVCQLISFHLVQRRTSKSTDTKMMPIGASLPRYPPITKYCICSTEAYRNGHRCKATIRHGCA